VLTLIRGSSSESVVTGKWWSTVGEADLARGSRVDAVSWYPKHRLACGAHGVVPLAVGAVYELDLLRDTLVGLRMRLGDGSSSIVDLFVLETE